MPTDMPADPSTERAPPVSRAVADDLESIFTQPGGSGGLVRRRLRLTGRAKREKTTPGSSGERRAARLGAVLASALIGVSAGALLAGVHPAQKPAPGRQLTVVAAPQPAPLSQLAAFAAPASQAAQLPPNALGAASASDRTPRPKKAVAREASRPGAAVKPQRTRVAEATCGRHARCGRSQVLAADARLRRAYSDAIRAGVSNTVLIDYRERWWNLRRHAPREPGRVVAGYRQMASELDRLAANSPRVHYAPPPQNGWRQLRTEIAGLWR